MGIRVLLSLPGPLSCFMKTHFVKMVPTEWGKVLASASSPHCELHFR